jgi:hypothetical protein
MLDIVYKVVNTLNYLTLNIFQWIAFHRPYTFQLLEGSAKQVPPTQCFSKGRLFSPPIKGHNEDFENAISDDFETQHFPLCANHQRGS